MAIKQIQLFDSVAAKHNLDVAQKAYDEQVPVAWGPITLDKHQLGVVDYYNHQKDRWAFIQAQEKELSDLIDDGWTVVSSYHLDHGVAGCQLILYKRDPMTQEEREVWLKGLRTVQIPNSPIDPNDRNDSISHMRYKVTL
jgi:hypothetical protein